MIEGLMLTMTGDELQRSLDARAAEHRQSAARWKRELSRTPDQQTSEEPLMPEQVCENEAEQCYWRADVLEFLRDHIGPSEVYRLRQSDLAFGELLPKKPGWLEQEEHEERPRAGLGLERVTMRVIRRGGPEIVMIQREQESG